MAYGDGYYMSDDIDATKIMRILAYDHMAMHYTLINDKERFAVCMPAYTPVPTFGMGLDGCGHNSIKSRYRLIAEYTFKEGTTIPKFDTNLRKLQNWCDSYCVRKKSLEHFSDTTKPKTIYPQQTKLSDEEEAYGNFKNNSDIDEYEEYYNVFRKSNQNLKAKPTTSVIEEDNDFEYMI